MESLQHEILIRSENYEQVGDIEVFYSLKKKKFFAMIDNEHVSCSSTFTSTEDEAMKSIKEKLDPIFGRAKNLAEFWLKSHYWGYNPTGETCIDFKVLERMIRRNIHLFQDKGIQHD